MKMFNRAQQGRRPINRLLCFCIALLAAAFLVSCQSEPNQTLPSNVTATPPRLQQYVNPAAFDLLYPATWTSVIIREGIIVFGTQAAINLDNTATEPSLLVYRQAPDANLDLDGVMDRFLEIGPLASGFTQVDRHNRLTIDSRPTVTTRVDREEGNDLDGATSIVTAIEADNTHRYILVATAPKTEFELWRPTFELMIASLQVNE